MKILKIYTDGACSGNQNDENIGGWGAVLEFGDARKELYGGEINTTNNRMELTAVIEALSALKRSDLTVQIFSDSSYVMDCFRQKWYIAWQKNGWKTSKKTPVENRELWEKLIALASQHNISFYRVKGHVNLDHPNTQIEKLYKKFVEWNGPAFTMDDFRYVTQMNNRADELANIGMEPYRGK